MNAANNARKDWQGLKVKLPLKAMSMSLEVMNYFQYTIKIENSFITNDLTEGGLSVHKCRCAVSSAVCQP